MDLVQNNQPTSRTVSLALDGFGREALEMLAHHHGISHSRFVQCAADHHLERDMPRPPFARETAGDRLEVVVDLPAESWEAIELECALDDLPLERLLEHAVLALIADLDSGRVAVRIAARLD